MKRIYYILLLFILQSALSYVNAQSTDRDYIRIGNKQFHQAKSAADFDKALTNYSKALEKKKTVEAFYNYANASLMLGQDSTALAHYQMADSLGFTNKLKRAQNFHNMGNIWYRYGVQQLRSNGQNAGQAFQNAVTLYKNALRCNPTDNFTRYNLAMAMHQLKKSQNGGGGQDKDQNDDKDKKDDQKKDEQKKQDQKKQEQDQQDQKDQMSDQAAEQLLNSAQQDEKSVQQKVKVNPQRRKSLEKDW